MDNNHMDELCAGLEDRTEVKKRGGSGQSSP